MKKYDNLPENMTTVVSATETCLHCCVYQGKSERQHCSQKMML